MWNLKCDFLEKSSSTFKFSSLLVVYGGEGVNKTKLLRVSALVFFAFSVALSISIPRVTAPFSRPTIYSCDDGGYEKNGFGLAEDVYACGDGYDSGEFVTVYVVEKGDPYGSSWAICDVSATADGSGSLGPVNLGTFAPGDYDIWVDRDGSGWLEYLTEPVDTFGQCPEGFFVIPEYWLGTILGLVGCFAAFGVFRVSKRKHQ